jgi:hypothetical protein
MKYLLWALTVLICFASCNNNSKTTNNKTAPYKFDTPKGWRSERIPFPISFAPQVAYTGLEDLRFTAGWGDPTSDEYWSYVFLWWLEGSPVINADVLEANLQAYYTGLAADNVTKRNIPANKWMPAYTTIQKIKEAPGDIGTYNGTISILDYMVQQPLILNCLIHVKKCASQNHTVVLFEIAPKPFEHITWLELNKLQMSFECNQ